MRKGEWLEADSARMLGENELGVEEPLPLYRAFEPIVGDARAAAARFGDPYLRANKSWEKRGRAALEAELAARGAAHLCTGNCPPPSDDEATVESGEEASEPETSDDCFYEGAAAHERAAQAERLARRVEPKDETDAYEQDCERALHDDARRSIFYGEPAACSSTCSRGWRRRAAGARWTSCMRGKSSARSSGASSVRLVTATRRHIAVMRGMFLREL